MNSLKARVEVFKRRRRLNETIPKVFIDELIDSLETIVEKMQKTLGWYADEKNNEWDVDFCDRIIQSEVMIDNGDRARQALKGESQ